MAILLRIILRPIPLRKNADPILYASLSTTTRITLQTAGGSASSPSFVSIKTTYQHQWPSLCVGFDSFGRTDGERDAFFNDAGVGLRLADSA
jgi:hypothetical protein